MELGEIAAYARDKYHITEEHRWAEQPDFSVLVHPSTGKWIALLLRTEDAQMCEIRCGSRLLSSASDPHICSPSHMKGDEWLALRIDGSTDPKMAFRLIDRAYIYGGQNGCMIFLGSELPANKTGYSDTPLPVRTDVPVSGRSAEDGADGRRALPEKIREMRRLYEYGFNSFAHSCRNFYIQGKFMEDFEDDYVWNGRFQRYFPTYHDLTTEQLRGYFTWRTAVRKGIFKETSTSFAYIYIYELLSGIGASSAEDSLEKLAEFERGYIDSGIGEESIRAYLHRWMLDLAVINGVSPDIARRYADKAKLDRDMAYIVLKEHKTHTDSEIFDALLAFCGKTASSPAVKEHPDECRHLFAAVWRNAAEYSKDGKKLLSLCFGKAHFTSWTPLHNAVCYVQYSKEDRVYELSSGCTYRLKGGKWSVKDCPSFDKKLIDGLMQETERQLRIYLGAGSPLKERPENKWAAPYIEAAIAADREEKRAAEAKKVKIRFDDLDRIRRDALHTQNSLLTEEERTEDISDTAPDIPDTPEPARDMPADIPVEVPVPAPAISLDPRQRQVIGMLLEGASVKDIIRSWGCMAEIFAEQLNELFFDEIGDTAVECDGDDITLTEDYREDIIRITGGNDK